jgi:hypothetical protein
MDEIRHILVERDILAGSRGGGGWLVQLLYAFQDEESIYLAMVFHFHVNSNGRNMSLVETSVH